MKSSTLRRSNLTKEKIAFLEELSKNRQRPYNSAPSVYVRQKANANNSKENELDVLWQNFKVNTKEDKSPGIYLATGFIAGAVAMLVMTTLLSFSFRGSSSPDLSVPVSKTKEKAKLTFIPADKNTPVENVQESAVAKGNESYVVKQGDTVAGIVVRFYGSYDIAKINNVMKVNNMKNPNDIKIGQQLIIPMD